MFCHDDFCAVAFEGGDGTRMTGARMTRANGFQRVFD
jgi:hypothetical protein